MNQSRLIFYFGLIAAAIGLSIYFDEPPKPAQKPVATQASGKVEAATMHAVDAQANAAKLEAERKARSQRQQLSTLETPLFAVSISNLNVGIAHVRLKGARYQTDGKPIDVVTTAREELLPLGVVVKGLALESAIWTPERLDQHTIVFRTQVQDTLIARKIQVSNDSYGLWITTTFQNRGDAARQLTYAESTHHYVTRDQEGSSGILASRAAGLSQGLCKHIEDLERTDRATLVEEGKRSFKQGVTFTGIENAYFLNAILPDKPKQAECTLWAQDRGNPEPIGALFSAALTYPEVTLAPASAITYRVAAFFGPKMPEDLARVGHGLPDAIDLGFFAQISQGLTWLLREIHKRVPNWGIAIILLTILVKLVLYPLTERSFRSMARLRQLKPEMDRINEMYANDREKKGAAVMELYRKQGINPMGGCLPQLLQLPVWFALYTSLSTNVELFHAPFGLWWQDLSAPDPFYVLPLALGLLMFVQQKITPNTMDPAQAKMMLYMMPVMITAFMLFLPAGLCLYMFTNSALSIGQQKLIEHRMDATPPSAAPPSSSESGAVEGAGEIATSSSNPKSRRPRRGR
jgi:YidC/Oxa1 family membrane protein insertase